MWVHELRQQCGDKLPIIIVGNKSDLESMRQIKLADAEEYAKKLMVSHFSASARTGNNVKQVFKALAESKWFYLLINFVCYSLGIVMSKAANKANKSRKVVSRGMLNVKGIDLDDDDENDQPIQLRSSEYKAKKQKKKCC